MAADRLSGRRLLHGGGGTHREPRAVLSGGEGFARWDLIPLYPTLRPYVELLLDSPGFFVMFWNSVKITLGDAGRAAPGGRARRVGVRPA